MMRSIASKSYTNFLGIFGKFKGAWLVWKGFQGDDRAGDLDNSVCVLSRGTKVLVARVLINLCEHLVL